MKRDTHTEGLKHRPGLEIVYGVFHPSLVVLDHVLVHVRIVGADVLLRAPVGHRAKLERWVLLLGMLELVARREGAQGRAGG